MENERQEEKDEGKSPQNETYTITQLCREFGVTPRALRFYEQKGLLHPSRRGWTRIFSHKDRARLKLILRGKKVGFTLAEIKEMLDLYNLKDGQISQLKLASRKMRERLQALRQQRVELEEAIADLERTCEIIDGMLKERLAREGKSSEEKPEKD
jgi:DNA-binding transcriptional MerR regulator